jgi:putative glutamine amidotransferase
MNGPTKTSTTNSKAKEEKNMTDTKLKVGITENNHLVTQMLRDFGMQTIYPYEMKTMMTKPDVILVPGGPDVNPELYGEEKLPGTHCVTKQRDLQEMHMINSARINGIPVVGICRGHQLLHVINGGSLLQHIEGHKTSAHGLYDMKGKKVEGLMVTTSHHQAVTLEEAKSFNYTNLLASEAEDGTKICEMFSDEDRKIHGVQFHPEYATATTECRNLFKKFLEMAAGVKTETETKKEDV